jgi:hypothetical protein
MAWTGKVFDHLMRRYVPISIEPRPEGALVHAELQYVWRDSGEVGDSSRVGIELGVTEGLISSWWVFEEPEERSPEGR